VGQRTLVIAPEKAPDSAFAVVVIRPPAYVRGQMARYRSAGFDLPYSRNVFYFCDKTALAFRSQNSNLTRKFSLSLREAQQMESSFYGPRTQFIAKRYNPVAP
jgi:hypothetical protein